MLLELAFQKGVAVTQQLKDTHQLGSKVPE